MRNSFVIKNIRKSLTRQLVFPALLLCLCIAIISSSPWNNHFSPIPLRQENHFADFFNEDSPHVTIKPETLVYSGYDYVMNGKIKGYYYYTLLDEFCQFYLLTPKEAEIMSGPSPTLEQLSLKGFLFRMDDIEYKTLTDSMAEDLYWSGDSLRKITSQYGFSTVNHFPIHKILLLVLLLFSLFLSMFDFMCSILFILFPLLSPTFHQLGRYGEIRTLLPKVEMEMRHMLLAKAGNIYLTPNYIVNIDTVRTIILPLESIAWMYYHGHIHRFFGFHLKLSYTLHIVAINGRSYEFTKKKQEDLDYILKIINDRFPDILIGYSEANKQESKQRKMQFLHTIK